MIAKQRHLYALLFLSMWTPLLGNSLYEDLEKSWFDLGSENHEKVNFKDEKYILLSDSLFNYEESESDLQKSGNNNGFRTENLDILSGPPKKVVVKNIFGKKYEKVHPTIPTNDLHYKLSKNPCFKKVIEEKEKTVWWERIFGISNDRYKKNRKPGGIMSATGNIKYKKENKRNILRRLLSCFGVR